MAKKINSIELLNSEGPILVAKKEESHYVIYDTSGEDIAILAEKDMQDFVHGDMILVDTKNNRYRYSEFPGSMKPDLKKLDEFIGIDTTDKTY
jgi:hypothetical protein